MTDITANTPGAPGAAPINNLLGRTGKDLDHLYIFSGREGLSGDLVQMAWDQESQGLRVLPARKECSELPSFTSAIIKCDFPATEFLPSWNIRLHHPTQGFRVFLRVFSDSSNPPSQWFFLGESGASSGAPVPVDSPEWGKTHIDYLELFRPANAFQVRIEFIKPGEGASAEPLLKRLFVHYSGQAPHATPVNIASSVRELVHIPVPYRSQLSVDREELRNHICCPTSLAMVMENYGTSLPTMEVCDAVYNSRYDMYGIWPQVSHVACQYGYTAWITRFRSHEDVKTYLASGKPIIASIRVGENELRHARYPHSNGHIIVIVGYKGTDYYIVNDPFSAGPTGAEIDYFTEDIEKVWLDKGGVAVLVEKEK